MIYKFVRNSIIVSELIVLVTMIVFLLFSFKTKINDNDREKKIINDPVDLNTDEHIEESNKQAIISLCSEFNDPLYFRSLVSWQKINPAIIAKLSIDEREFPLADSDYYLDHDYKGNHDIFGTPYLVSGNSFSIIYGHSVYGGDHDLMFTFINSFIDENIFKKVSCFFIEDNLSKKKYQFSALLDVDLNNDEWNGFFDVECNKYELIEHIKKESLIYNDISADDELMLLVTCNISKANSRYILVGKNDI